MKKQSPIYNKETIQELNNQGFTLNMLADKYNVCPSSVGRALRKLGIEYNVQVRKIEKDHTIFSVIDSEIKAYLLGFLVADGCVYDKGRFGLCIAEQDLYIINLFRSVISPDSLIKTNHNTKGAKNRQNQMILRISSEKIVSDLARYGIVERKTFKPINLPKIEDSLKWHFIRGYFDGDGHLGIKVTKNGYKTCRICLSNGDRQILEDIHKFTKVGKLRKQGNCWRLDIENISDCKTFLDNMYKNSNYSLPRKYNKFLVVNAEVFAVSKKIAKLRNA